MLSRQQFHVSLLFAKIPPLPRKLCKKLIVVEVIPNLSVIPNFSLEDGEEGGRGGGGGGRERW